MISKKTKMLCITLALAFFMLIGGAGLTSNLTTHQVNAADAYDLSEWQGNMTNHQAKKLKHEVGFVILRAQNGSRRTDQTFEHSKALMKKYHIPYGVYSFSLYKNSRMARKEARALHRRAPHAKFYVNDIETNNAVKHLGRATKAWARQMKRLTKRPVVLYSYANFIQTHLNKARKSYNTIWLAGYSSTRPATGFKYGLWQFTDKHYSKALRKRIDASRLEDKPLTFWIGKKHAHKQHVISGSYQSVKHQVKKVQN